LLPVPVLAVIPSVSGVFAGFLPNADLPSATYVPGPAGLLAS
jgi:hypothetical protein